MALHSDELRDDLPLTGHDDVIADVYLQSVNFVLVAEAGIAHDDAANLHGLEVGHWSQRARSANLNRDA